jgi:hypothetical protein
MREAVGDPRPARRIVDRNAGIEKVQRERRCRACGQRRLHYIHRMHLVGKGVGGDDVDENIVPGCGSGTTGCHGALHDHGAVSYPSLLRGKPWTAVAAALRANLRPDEVGYVLLKKGSDYLEGHYPSG